MSNMEIEYHNTTADLATENVGGTDFRAISEESAPTLHGLVRGGAYILSDLEQRGLVPLYHKGCLKNYLNTAEARCDIKEMYEAHHCYKLPKISLEKCIIRGVRPFDGFMVKDLKLRCCEMEIDPPIDVRGQPYTHPERELVGRNITPFDLMMRDVPQLEKLTLRFCYAIRYTVNAFTYLTKLQKLKVLPAPFLSELPSLPELRHLNLACHNVTVTGGLPSFSKLEVLRLNGCYKFDAAATAPAPNMRALTLECTVLSAHALVDKYPNVEKIKINNDAVSLVPVMKAFKKLWWVYIGGDRQYGENIFDHLAQIAHLRTLALSFCEHVDGAGLEKLKGLQELHIEYCTNLNVERVKKLRVHLYLYQMDQFPHWKHEAFPNALSVTRK